MERAPAAGGTGWEEEGQRGAAAPLAATPADRCPCLARRPFMQAIYAGRVLKDDNAKLSDFVVPVSEHHGRCKAGLASALLLKYVMPQPA